MKVYINNRNYLTWPKNMVEVLQIQGHDVEIIDNASTYQPLLDWYDSNVVKVHRLDQNLGPSSPWLSGVIDYSNYYVITDPDLDISDIPDDWDEFLIKGLNKYGCGKCGFSLDETKIPPSNPAWIPDEFNLYPDGDHPARWGSHIKLGRGYINYPIDTTFALYHPNIQNHFIGGIRTDRPYTARHLPWHIVLDETKDEKYYEIKMDEEIYNYFINCGNGTGTKSRIQEMLREYEKR